jgi:hypothetical protein
MVHLQDQKNKADAFRAMHRGTNVLLLPNAWDVISARIFEEAGFPFHTRLAATGRGAGKSRLVSHPGHTRIAAKNGPGIEDRRNLPVAGRRALPCGRESIVGTRHPPAKMYH